MVHIINTTRRGPPPKQDERLWMGIHKTDSGRFLVMNLGGKQQNESWVLDLLGACTHITGAEGHHSWYTALH